MEVAEKGEQETEIGLKTFVTQKTGKQLIPMI